MPDAGRQLERETLRRLLAVANHLSASTDLTAVLTVIIDAMRDVLCADRATVFEFDPATDELFSSVAHGISTTDADPTNDEIRFPATAGIAGECAQSRMIINVPDAYADARFNQDIDRQTGYRTRSILTIPLIGHDDTLVGVAQVLNTRNGVFSANDEEIATALGAQAAVALKRVRLLEDHLVRTSLERELDVARGIQQGCFPKNMPILDAFEVAGWSEPAQQTGGDAYDVIIGAETDLASDAVLLFMADATGHGVGPAISVMQLRSMLRLAARVGAVVPDLVHHINAQLCADLPSGRFITAWFAIIGPGSKTLYSFSAGQAPLLRYIHATQQVETFDADTVPLGVVPELDANLINTIDMQSGDIYVVLSDGIYEAMNPDMEQFGTQRVRDLIAAHHDASAETLVTIIRDAVNTFADGRPADDDRTGLIIRAR
ncbi:MAG: SpoIIE family protein phosphatase [Phycisphaerales bacterium]|nr:SpoIIE family protein phosphatase [Phycisphaerales bacterium]